MNDDGDYCSCSLRRVRDIDRGGACTARLASVGSLRPDEPETSASGVPQEVFGRYQILSRIALANWNVGETQPALRPLRRSRSNSVTQEVKLPREDAKLLALVANLKEIPDL